MWKACKIEWLCVVLAGAVSPMTSSTVCFGNGANVTGSTVAKVWKSKDTESGKALKWRSFQCTNSSTSVCVKGQHNAGSNSGKEPDSLTLAKWELIHFVNVLFCTASCSSVNQSPDRHYQSHAIINKAGIKTQSSHCLLFGELIRFAELDGNCN